METAQEILLLLSHKGLLPLFTDVIQHLRRIIVLIPAPGLHHLILGWQKTDLLANLALHSPGSIPPCGTLLPGPFTKQQLPIPPNHQPRHIGGDTIFPCFSYLAQLPPDFQPCSSTSLLRSCKKNADTDTLFSPPNNSGCKSQPISRIKQKMLSLMMEFPVTHPENSGNQTLTYCHFPNIVLSRQVYIPAR